MRVTGDYGRDLRWRVAYAAALRTVFPHAEIEVVGDAVAVLEAGAGIGHAVAIVCGAGLNAVARGPLGMATVPALGWASGDRTYLAL